MSVPFMIGICGGTWGDGGVGKTTVANILAKQLGFYPVSFIDPVKEIAKKFFGWDGKIDSEARVLLDRICRMGRSISENYWRDLAVSRIPKDASCNKIVFDDVWFDNEVRMIIDGGGKIIRVTKRSHNFLPLPCETIDIPNEDSLLSLQRLVMLKISPLLE